MFDMTNAHTHKTVRTSC